MDFDSLRNFNDYLEMVEGIIFNLCDNVDILATNKKIAEYREVTKAQIAKNTGEPVPQKHLGFK